MYQSSKALDTEGMMFHPGNIATPKGFQAFGAHGGIRRRRLDMALIWSERPAVVSGLFTTNFAKAAPLILTEQVVRRGRSQAAVINSGNANALTGAQGLADAEAMQRMVAHETRIAPELVAVASTGVIGVPLPMDAIKRGIRELVGQWADPHYREDVAGVNASQAILTTDTTAKTLAVRVSLAGGPVSIGLMAKGSGMIHPQMATMLGFFTTDADIEKERLDAIVRQAVDRSFHRVSVDGDPSTNDMVLCWANGASGVAVKTPEDEALFAKALTLLAQEGARMVARDGEGATHLLTIRIGSARTEHDAAQKARTAARSALVKAAVYGRDANWGRVMAAIGSVGDAFDADRVTLRMNGLLLFDHGRPVDFDEERARALMGEPEVVFEVDLGQGDAEAEAWGCDLTERYVEINAHYRT